MCQGHIPTQFMRLGANKVTFVMKVDVNIINSYLYGLFLCNGFVLPPENEEVGQLRVCVIDCPARWLNIIIRSAHLSFTRSKTLLRITIKVMEGKIRSTIRTRHIKVPIGFCRKLILRSLILWWYLHIDRRSSLTRLILNTNTNKLHLSTKNMVTY